MKVLNVLLSSFKLNFRTFQVFSRFPGDLRTTTHTQSYSHWHLVVAEGQEVAPCSARCEPSGPQRLHNNNTHIKYTYQQSPQSWQQQQRWSTEISTVAKTQNKIKAEVRTCECHLLRRVELDGVDCGRRTRRVQVLHQTLLSSNEPCEQTLTDSLSYLTATQHMCVLWTSVVFTEIWHNSSSESIHFF